MKKPWNILVVIGALTIANLCLSQENGNERGAAERDRVQNSGQVLKEILDMPDTGIPKSVIKDCKCLIVLPSVKKVAVGIGGSYGRGLMTCRTGPDYKGAWSAPIMMESTGANIGFQFGGQATDFVIAVMNDQGARSLLSNDVKLGGDASIAAGPVGRTAEASTNVTMQAQMLSYSRSRGVFGGVSLSGATLGPDHNANENLYGRKVTPEEIIAGKRPIPPSANQLIEVLNSQGHSAEK
jgi:SH3 domain-containing YSC84-like protein 1